MLRFYGFYNDNFCYKYTITLLQISTWTYGKWYDHDIDQAKGCTSVYMRHLHEKVLTFKQIFVNKYPTIDRNNLNKIYPCFNEIYDIFLMNVSYCDIKSFYYYLEIILKLLYIIP